MSIAVQLLNDVIKPVGLRGVGYCWVVTVTAALQVVGRQRPSQYPFCDICKMINHKHREATSKCLDCAKLLCSTCVQLHKDTKVTSAHSIFDVEIEKEVECKEHQV